MENEIINALANEIVKKLKGKLDIEKEMKDFLISNISQENKEQTLEQLYLFQLFSNAYVGPDPRGKSVIFANAILILKAKDDEELTSRMKKLRDTVEVLKSAELNPFFTTKKMLEDKEKYKNVIF